MPTSLGLVGIVDKGVYSSAATYVKGNFVYYNGSTWLLKVATATGIEPNENNSTTWQYLAKGFNVLPFEGATDSADGTGGTVPQPLAGDEGKFLKGDGSWANVPNPSTMIGATSSDAGAGGLVPQPLAGDEDKVLQGNGTFGKKLQMDVVVQNNQYGYINGSNQFVAFKSQSDIDAAVAAANGNLAPAYNASSTYAVGDLCTNLGKLWKNKIAISTAHAWNASEWDDVTTSEVYQPKGHVLATVTADGVKTREALLNELVYGKTFNTDKKYSLVIKESTSTRYFFTNTVLTNGISVSIYDIYTAFVSMDNYVLQNNNNSVARRCKLNVDPTNSVVITSIGSTVMDSGDKFELYVEE